MPEERGQGVQPDAVEAPRGSMTARVDEKGRLKLPAAITQYLDALGEKKVFVTSLDGVSVRIYPISSWKQTERALEEAGEDAEARDEVAFMAYHYGADAEIDPQGRVLVPTDLRRDLSIENEQVHLRCFKGRVDLMSHPQYERMLAASRDGLPDKLKGLEKKGLR